jgi:glycosyltransferase involved in cell wall biosynthesis
LVFDAIKKEFAMKLNRSILTAIFLLSSVWYAESRILYINPNTDQSVHKKALHGAGILKVLMVNGFGGIESLEIALHKHFLQKGYNMHLVVAKDSLLDSELTRLGIAHYASDAYQYASHPTRYSQFLLSDLLKICYKEKIAMIHSHKPEDYAAVKQAAGKLRIKAIAHYHCHLNPKPELFKDFQAVIFASPLVARVIEEQNKTLNLGLKNLQFIQPPHNESKFLDFKTDTTKEKFFKDEFNIDLKPCPIICMVANLVKHKNHKLLFEAVGKLVYEHKTPVEVMLCGDGFMMKPCKEMVKKMKLEDYIHFLGYTRKIPEIFFFSDMKVLTSSEEAFGLVLLEAALMKKPIILSRGASMAGVFIQHETTGLLCDSKDPDDLVAQIKRLINDPAFGKTLGENAYTLALTDFSDQEALYKFENVYLTVYRSR